ncbi:hypothetical protein [Shewanella violacea]|uniref:Uncharacterized protein n=1 Tax=Shewanella violacea (strain JCM 10179 / CIP 106290 / LMG 19151 / DSS12) TaxID=637905 RepID=D4ZLI8_SHEVD|nr:hypothetical protein [Shewanella violacea]BAJ02537.1 hypothetical protein SVI_2566 [Shewanella violacea DSS12]
MLKLTRILTTVIIAASPLLFVPSSNAVDSFFDVFFEIEVRASSPLGLTATVEMQRRGGTAQTFDTEILSMDLTSSGSLGASDGTGRDSQHNAMVQYRVKNIGSSGQDGVRFAEVEIICDPDCRVTKTRSMTKREHRGHVTVLK